uniref:DUF3298 domain-containing protein n=1 Tax=Gracilinema caldarium TaxID=215591 RepID=A0A7C3EK59_9SPIR
MNHWTIRKKALCMFFIASVVTICIVLSCSSQKTYTALPISMAKHEFKILAQDYPVTKAVLEYPVFKGTSQSKILVEQINYHIGPEGILGKKPDELEKDFIDGLVPFISAKAEVVYYGKGFLQVLWTVESIGAYSGTSRITVLVELEKGITHGPESMFEDDLAMARFVDKQMMPLVEKALADLYAEYPDVKSPLIDMGLPLPYGPDDLFNLQLEDGGLRFIYSFKFPQSFIALEPEPIVLFIPWKDIEPFTYEGSILKRIYN